MKAWVTKFTGEYSETEDNITYAPAIAIEVKPKPSLGADTETKIQKEMYKLLRAQAIKSLGIVAPTPDPIPIEPIE